MYVLTTIYLLILRQNRLIINVIGYNLTYVNATPRRFTIINQLIFWKFNNW